MMRTTRVVKPLFTRSFSKVTLAEGVEFDKIAREWRMKWTADNNKQSLVLAQKALAEMLPSVKQVNGVQSVQRIVCGGCHDFKVIVSLPVKEFKEWEANKFQPEEAFLGKVRGISGVSQVETQTYTLETL